MKRIIALVLTLSVFLGGCVQRGGGNTAPKIFVEPDAGRAPVLDAVKDARSSIDLVTYLFTDGQVMDALADAASRGVKVRVMLEPHPYGGYSNFETVRSRMDRSGIEFEASSPAFHMTHEKAMIVDGKVAWVMTGNMTNSAFEHNREFLVEVRDPEIVKEIEQVFDADWNRNLITPSHPDLIWGPDNARRRLEERLQTAESSIYMEEEEFLDEEVLSLLIADVHRGVEVKVIVPQTRLDQAYDRVLLKKLQDAGGKVVGIRKPFMHAKLILVDGSVALVGSVNLSPASLDQNRELGIFVSDTGALGTLADTFDRDWTAATASANPTPEEIRSEEAGRHIGEDVIVTGRVASAFKGEKAVYLHVGASDFIVVIFNEDLKNFPMPPDKMYSNKKIRVHGVIKMYHNQSEIIVHTPDQIEVLP
jgi:phosphatidylserine/phosphatidylglycerophosphate/cardiolipin synthase-like enzyme